MKILTCLMIMVLLAVTAAFAASPPPVKMRPYTGIGILLLPLNVTPSGAPVLLYDEPALSRLGELNRAKIPTFDWIFGTSPDMQPLIVTARKGTWLRISYDDAGREAWLNPTRQMTYQGWDYFLKSNVSQLLPGLQKKFYLVFQQPGSSPIATLTVKQQFKVLQLENDWALALIEQKTLGWLRWRDEDGRLLLGIVREPRVRQP